MQNKNIVVIRREELASDHYVAFLRMTAQVNGAEVIVDRRVRERRSATGDVSPNRRSSERRQTPIEPLLRDGAMLIRRAAPEPAPSRRRQASRTLLSQLAAQLFERLLGRRTAS